MFSVCTFSSINIIELWEMHVFLFWKRAWILWPNKREEPKDTSKEGQDLN